MRNLLEYPVTKDEVVRLLESYLLELNQDAVGDLQPMVLQSLIKVMKRDFKSEDFNP